MISPIQLTCLAERQAVVKHKTDKRTEILKKNYVGIERILFSNTIMELIHC